MKIGNATINVVKDDITEIVVDAVVNPANTELKMEEGLAGIIKKKGGEQIEEEAKQQGPVDIGGAVWTNAGQLRSSYIIHAAVMDAVRETNQDYIRQAVKSVLKCADELKLRSIAFPALGCGIGEFPETGSAKIMVQEIMRFFKEGTRNLSQITFCLYDNETFGTFNNTVRSYIRHIQETLGPGPYITVDIIIELNEGVIVIERSNPPYGWALPGGFVNYGESLEQAAIREAKEETDMDVINLRQFHTYSQPDRDPRFHTISTVFIAKGKGIPQSGDDAKDLKIVRYEELSELEYAFDHMEIIKEYLMEREFN